MSDHRFSTRGFALLLLLAAAIAATIAVLQPSRAEERLQQGPVNDPAAPAGARGTNPPDVTNASRAAAQLPRLHSLLVSWRGALILEHYAGGVRATNLANIKSASKSVISALVGIAIERGHIKGVDEPIERYFPELGRDPDPRKRKITIGDLLSMRSGLESTSGGNYGRWVRSSNWVRHALARPLISDPGTSMEYSTGSSHLLSAILTKATKTTTWQFAQSALMKPIGVTLARWTQDPQGIFMGGNEMLMTPRQMVTFGELYANEGRHQGRQIVSARWVETSCEPRTASRWNSDRRYGYGWWMRELGGREACFAWGYGGQYIFVFRDLGLVVVTTSSTAVDEERRGYRRMLFDLVAREIVVPIDGATR
jgi:CubicO group peptidase (beta-lactamase class C family)